ncbi:MAG: hypothetical protein V4507_06865 [Verrucomicrobiota bacterium]
MKYHILLRCLYGSLFNCGLALVAPMYGATIQVPIEIVSPDALSQTKTLTLHTSTGTGLNLATLYLQVHNLRYQGELSLRFNGKEWIELSNSNVTFDGNDGKFGGIGGIQGTVRIKVGVPASWRKTGPQTLDLRFNGTDGNVTAVRILDIKLLDDFGNNLITDTLVPEDVSKWTSPIGYESINQQNAGKALWSKTSNLVDNPISKLNIKASCASCHFQDGGDLHYFNYSNESIIARAQYHGLTLTEGSQIAAYIRNLSSTIYPPNGRPWNPPFQPGPGLQTKSRDQWAVGAGLESVVMNEKESFVDFFRKTSGFNLKNLTRLDVEKVIDHGGKKANRENSGAKNPPIVNLREMRISFQFPDWNAWLPRYAPEDIWSGPQSRKGDAALITDPFIIAYNSFKSGVSNSNVFSTLNFGAYIKDENFTKEGGTYRLGDQNLFDKTKNPDGSFTLAQDLGLATRRNPDLTREEMALAVSQYVAVKTFNIVREFNLEDRATNPNVLGEDGERSFPSGNSTVFDLAPHISAHNWSYRRGQSLAVGKMTSNQWYHLQLLLNAGMRGNYPMNSPLDWDYQLEHTINFSRYSKVNSSAHYFSTILKMYESRDNGNGLNKNGFSFRTLHPSNLYNNREINQGGLDSIDPGTPESSGLWVRMMEEFLYEWLDVVSQYDVNKLSQVSRMSLDLKIGDLKHDLPAKTASPMGWNGVGNKGDEGSTPNHLDSTWQYLPLFLEEGIDRGLLEDCVQWAKWAWPGPVGNRTPWDSLLKKQYLVTDPAQSTMMPKSLITLIYGNRVIPNRLWSENFEENKTDFNNTTIKAIKNVSTYVKMPSSIPKNGGGIYIGSDLLINGSRPHFISTADVVLTPGVEKLRLRSRVASDAFPSTNSVKTQMQIGFNNGEVINGNLLMSLDPTLSGWKFQTYETALQIPDGATAITSVNLISIGDNITKNKNFYFDNIEVFEVPVPYADSAPSTVSVSAVYPVVGDNMEARNGDKNGTTFFNTGLNIAFNRSASPHIQGYNIYRSVDGQTWEKRNFGLVYVDPQAVRGNWMDFFNEAKPAYIYSETNKRYETIYQYKVTAVNQNGLESSLKDSSSAKGSLIDDVSPWLNAKNLRLDLSTVGLLHWFASEEWDLAGYNVYSCDPGSLNFKKMNTSPTLDFQFYDANPVSGKRYKVVSVDVAGNEYKGDGNHVDAEIVIQPDIFNSFQLWAKSYGLPTDGTGLGAPNATPAGDQIPNLIKASLGIVPTVSGYQGRMPVGQKPSSLTPLLMLTYQRPTMGMEQYVYIPEASSDLVNWSAAEVSEFSRVDLNGITTVKVKDLKPGPTRFLRLRVQFLP